MSVTDWFLIGLAILTADAIVIAAVELFLRGMFAPHSGRHTRAARLASPEAVDRTQPVPVAARELDGAGVA